MLARLTAAPPLFSSSGSTRATAGRERHPPPQAYAMSIFVWSMIGIAIWHFTVLVPDRFWGGIVGAFLAAWLGALASGVLLPEPRDLHTQPAWCRRGAVGIARFAGSPRQCYWYGARQQRREQPEADAAKHPVAAAWSQHARAR